MKKYPKIDYRMRPVSYWAELSGLAALLRNIKGTTRRRYITSVWKSGNIKEIPAELLQPALSEAAREQFGRIHPHCMGGEFLPDYKDGEVEIARIELCSTTADVISIRARRDGRKIRYRVVDEYDTEFCLARETSAEPLSLGELVGFIEGSSHPDYEGTLSLCYNLQDCGGGDRSHSRNFTEIRSDFYPQLEEHYERVFADWAKPRRRRAKSQ